MFISRNAVEVEGFPNYKSSGTFRLDEATYAYKLTVVVHSAPVVLQITEHEKQFFDNAYDTETELDLGTHSLAFVTPITGWRFRRGAGGEPASVDFKAYG